MRLLLLPLDLSAVGNCGVDRRRANGAVPEVRDRFRLGFKLGGSDDARLLVQHEEVVV